MNTLKNEASLYLQQHANNPVHWQPWSKEAFEKAEVEGKLVLISIGYSSCHWCHVMEHESFEDEAVAEIMNRDFVCIKVDREDRPDIDSVYMNAVQLMTQQGGWPLNCFTLPNGEPIFGGTYFPKEKWIYSLNALTDAYKNEPDRCSEYAKQLSAGIKKMDSPGEIVQIQDFNRAELDELILRWKKSFDNLEGGTSRAPKFPLPSNYLFLQAFGVVYQDQHVLNHVDLTLDKMACGGIYDQVDGGFSRYSTDLLWKAPHFEKMGYDNGQLISLYAQAYKRTQNPMYARIIEETVSWLEKEMRASFGAFYSAIDADSEGEEGKYYVYTLSELKTTIGTEWELFSSIFHTSQKGLWEHGNYIIQRKEADLNALKTLNLTLEEFYVHLEKFRLKLHEIRSNREKPVIDYKCLTAWNSMIISGLAEAFEATSNSHYLELAKIAGDWLFGKQMNTDGSLFRRSVLKNDKQISDIDGFLEDYAHAISAGISLYRATGKIEYLNHCQKLLFYVKTHFEDVESGLFLNTKIDSELISRTLDLNDNVIPAANSVMANNLFKLGYLIDNQAFIEQAKKMLASVKEGMVRYGEGHSNWAILYLLIEQGEFSMTIFGENALEMSRKISQMYLPKLNNVKIKINSDTLRIEVCGKGNCFLPVKTLSEALTLLG